ncbi:MAG: hypothetical protein ABIG44_07370 [Planctomycetota bacterium]
MKFARLVILIPLLVIGLTIGCAQQKATTIAPTQDELPTFDHSERITPLSVGVEGRGYEPRVLLVPTFEEPELTPEECVALGLEAEPYNWLEFYKPLPAEYRILAELGGVRAGIHGLGSVGYAHGFYGPIQAISGQGGVSTGALNENTVRYYAGSPMRPVQSQGPRTTVEVGVNPARTISSHQTRAEP